MTFKNSARFYKAGLVTAALVVMAAPSVSFADTLYRELGVGMSGADVTSLQTYLALDTTIYPEGRITGYFGLLTKAAVARFQSRNDIPSVGRVGPITLPILNTAMSKGMTYSGNAPTLSNISVNAKSTSSTISWDTDKLSRGVVYYSTSPLSVNESIQSVAVSGQTAQSDANYHTSHSVYFQNLQSNTVYYYMIHTIDQTGNVTVSWPSAFKTNN